MNPDPRSKAAVPATRSIAFEIEQGISRALVAHLQPIKQELAGLRRAAALPEMIYQTFRLAFFKGRSEPLSFANIDYLIFTALQSDIRYVSFDADTRRIVLTKDGIHFATDAYFYILLELFAYEEYGIVRSLVDRPFVVYDVGMNRGYAALWFANHPQCEAVYGFELMEEPYEFALQNIKLNPQLAPKIKPLCIGLGGEDKSVELIYEEATDGVSTTVPEFYRSYWSAERKTQALRKKVQLRRASDVFGALPPCRDGTLRVLKIDVEGAEYDIIADLVRAGRLDFDIILAEAHLGLPKLLSLMPGYKPFQVVQHSELMANVALVRER